MAIKLMRNAIDPEMKNVFQMGMYGEELDVVVVPNIVDLM